MAAAPHALEAFGVSDAMMRVPSTTKMRLSPSRQPPCAQRSRFGPALIDGIGSDSEIAAAEEEETWGRRSKEEVVEEKWWKKTPTAPLR